MGSSEGDTENLIAENDLLKCDIFLLEWGGDGEQILWVGLACMGKTYWLLGRYGYKTARMLCWSVRECVRGCANACFCLCVRACACVLI